MEVKIQGEEMEHFIYEPFTGELFKSKQEVIEKIQSELNDKLNLNDHVISLNEMLEIITEEWPDEQKERFWQRHYEHAGWFTEKELTGDRFIQLKTPLIEDGKIIIQYDLEPMDKNEEPE